MLLVPYILYKWSDLVLSGKISFLMSLGEDLGLKSPIVINQKLHLEGLENRGCSVETLRWDV